MNREKLTVAGAGFVYDATITSFMKFQEFWKVLAAELNTGKKFNTMKSLKPFEARLSDTSAVTVTPQSSGEPRLVPIRQFQEMWEIMKNDMRSERYVNRNKRYYSFWSSSYINKLIDHVVGDQHME